LICYLLTAKPHLPLYDHILTAQKVVGLWDLGGRSYSYFADRDGHRKYAVKLLLGDALVVSLGPFIDSLSCSKSMYCASGLTFMLVAFFLAFAIRIWCPNKDYAAHDSQDLLTIAQLHQDCTVTFQLLLDGVGG
jgi:hypothetical protein